MKCWNNYGRWLLKPLVYIAALCLLAEEWLWAVGARLMRWVARFPPLHALETRIQALPPYPALALLLLPTVLLFPVKILALLAIARGHAWSGVCVILLAKLGGAAAVARLYALTLPRLRQLPWFALWHERCVRIGARWIAQLRATRAWRRISGLAALLESARRAWWAARRARRAGRHGSRAARVLRRFAARWRAHRR